MGTFLFLWAGEDRGCHSTTKIIGPLEFNFRFERLFCVETRVTVPFQNLPLHNKGVELQEFPNF